LGWVKKNGPLSISGPSVRVSVHLSVSRGLELCGLWIHPHMDVDPPKYRLAAR